MLFHSILSCTQILQYTSTTTSSPGSLSLIWSCLCFFYMLSFSSSSFFFFFPKFSYLGFSFPLLALFLYNPWYHGFTCHLYVDDFYWILLFSKLHEVMFSLENLPGSSNVTCVEKESWSPSKSPPLSPHLRNMSTLHFCLSHPKFIRKLELIFTFEI